MESKGRKYHPDHFLCGQCEAPLGTANFYEVEGKCLCDMCYSNSMCPTCGSCGTKIKERCATALNKKWHVSCFVCQQCRAPFPNGAFFEKNGMPFCKSCFDGNYATKCAACNQVVTGKVINAINRTWHSQCFACDYCNVPFDGNVFYERDGKAFCKTHFQPQQQSVCDACKAPISGNCLNALGKQFHPEHFVCTYCGNGLLGGPFYERNGQPFCQSCSQR